MSPFGTTFAASQSLEASIRIEKSDFETKCTYRFSIQNALNIPIAIGNA